MGDRVLPDRAPSPGGDEAVISCDPTGLGYRVDVDEQWTSAALGRAHGEAYAWFQRHGIDPTMAPIQWYGRCSIYPQLLVPQDYPKRACFRPAP